MKRRKIYFVAIIAITLVVVSCSTPGHNDTGSEYMPDMGHSIAYEANAYDYYYYNTWGSEDDYYKLAKPRQPVKGTIARGYVGVAGSASPQQAYEVMKMHNGQSSPNAIAVPVNGSVPYYYGDSDAERERAIAEIINNPFPITEKGLAQGKELYNIYCGICHGEKGDGNGWLVDETNANAVYPAQPRSFLDDEWTAKSNGAYYHSIMYGKGVMGAYTDKLSYEERWQVIHWIRALQAKDDKLEYSETANTLNDIEIPGASMPKLAMDMDTGHEEKQDSDNDSHEDHGEHAKDDHGDGDHGH